MMVPGIGDYVRLVYGGCNGRAACTPQARARGWKGRLSVLSRFVFVFICNFRSRAVTLYVCVRVCVFVSCVPCPVEAFARLLFHTRDENK